MLWVSKQILLTIEFGRLSSGETDISTSQVITQQPLLGSVYRSQNVDAWTEDLSQDIKFVMKRAVFTTDILQILD